MTPASLVLAAALAAWGPVAPAPEPEQVPTGDVAAPAATSAAAPPVAPAEPPASPAPAPPGASAARPAPPALIAKAPLDVRATPAIVTAPAPTKPPSKPLHKRWAFWAIAGGLFAASIVVTYVATRPKPEPYTGNAPPYFVSFP